MADGRGFPAGLPAELEDWITVWHSELAALAGDREWHEAMARGADAWAAQARTVAALLAGAPDADGRPGPDAAPGAAAPAAAPGESGTELRELRNRVAELERRLG